MWKEIKVLSIPSCDFCDKPGPYDAPTKYGGTWANMCGGHMLMHTAKNASLIGTKKVLKPDPKPPTGDVVWGIEVNSMEEIVMDGTREIECPECGDLRSVEPDACYKYQCDCGVSVQVPQGVF